ncbi:MULTISPECIES: DeoR/GlpR family DNA-binding transcription regulator [unclassified Bordetella]|uniref:DeoR/GlpR family DNA-binding transcription regulator n=1 Tax=unclassified Bordetella TaxID=2630031 RepID=UPI001324E79F|nr:MULTISPECIES: DeoR/GlpR family DNA-binding transcription regulator [unclassified Bordetella]MVW73418.1 DeoR family transcriptional regulator [Bordetella sp. 15P40C-2]MVW80003.1 DeoR family transcriptional regulator [Bordetella sp. 02P26C-1]
MILNPRQSALVEMVRSQGSASIESLARHFDVTLQTVRRDVNLLADAGLLSRFHGGVRIESSTIENIAYRKRQGLHAEAKQRIAQAVADAVPDGCSLILNIGTTTEAIARALMRHRGLRVITNNLHVADILADNPDCEVILAGGVVRSRDRGIVGEATIDFIRQFKVDIGLIGISGIETDGTLRDYDFREVRVARCIIEQSREVWLAADSSKFERQAMVELAHISQINRFFTDAQPPAPLAQALQDAGVRCVVAEPAVTPDADDTRLEPQAAHQSAAEFNPFSRP